jgi:hypothetical protein
MTLSILRRPLLRPVAAVAVVLCALLGATAVTAVPAQDEPKWDTAATAKINRCTMMYTAG